LAAIRGIAVVDPQRGVVARRVEGVDRLLALALDDAVGLAGEDLTQLVGDLLVERIQRWCGGRGGLRGRGRSRRRGRGRCGGGGGAGRSRRRQSGAERGSCRASERAIRPCRRHWPRRRTCWGRQGRRRGPYRRKEARGEIRACDKVPFPNRDDRRARLVYVLKKEREVPPAIA